MIPRRRGSRPVVDRPLTTRGSDVATPKVHPGDRYRLFSAITDSFAVTSVLFPGSFINTARSFVFDSVTYVDVIAQAAHRGIGCWRGSGG